MFEVLFETLAEKSAAKKAHSAKSNLHVVAGAKPVTAEVSIFPMKSTMIAN
jgi:hypothetical protein